MLKNYVTEKEEYQALSAFMEANGIHPGPVKAWLDDLWNQFVNFLRINNYTYGMTKRRFSSLLSESLKNGYSQRIENGKRLGMHKHFFINKLDEAVPNALV